MGLPVGEGVIRQDRSMHVMPQPAKEQAQVVL
jgi:hypothetical protein